MNMRIETKLIKQIIKKEFPQLRAGVYVKKPTQYYTNSDKVFIEVLDNGKIPYGDILRVIEKYSRNIAVGRYGSVLTIGGNIDPKLFDVVNDTWVEVEAEFIYIKY